MVIIKSFLITLALATNGSIAFSPCVLTKSVVTSSTSATSSTQLYFGIPTFGAGQNKNNNDDNKSGENKKNEKAIPEKKIGLSGLAQLITAGMGSPFLGDFEGVDKETGKFMFSLEANNLVDDVSKTFLYYNSLIMIAKLLHYVDNYNNNIIFISFCTNV